jgi:hypothetical protein
MEKAICFSSPFLPLLLLLLFSMMAPISGDLSGLGALLGSSAGTNPYASLAGLFGGAGTNPLGLDSKKL